MKLLKVFFSLLVATLFLLMLVITNKPNGNRVSIICNNKFIQGNGENISVCVTDLNTLKPTSGLKVKAYIEGSNVKSTVETNSQRFTDFFLNTKNLSVGKKKLNISIYSNKSRIHHSLLDVEVIPGDETEIFTDKPIYQPGQTINVRFLTRSKVDGKPVSGCKVLLELQDPKKNIITKESLVSSDYGISWIKIPLAEKILLGEYIIQANVGNEFITRSVQVEKYQLPRFALSLNHEFVKKENQYVLKGAFEISHASGHEIQNPKVEVIVNSKRVTLDENKGSYSFAEVVSILKKYRFVAKIIDGSGYSEEIVREIEKVDVSRNVNSGEGMVYLIPEKIFTIPGEKNTFFAYAFDKNGLPLECGIYVQSSVEHKEFRTNSIGIGKVELMISEVACERLFVAAYDKRGEFFIDRFPFPNRFSEWYRGYFNQHIDCNSKHNTFILSRSTCKSGEDVDITYPHYNTHHKIYDAKVIYDNVVVPIFVEGQKTSFTIPQNFHGFAVIRSLLFDNKLGKLSLREDILEVEKNYSLNVDSHFNQESYLPGDTALLTLQITNSKTKSPVKSAISLNIIDKSVSEIIKRSRQAFSRPRSPSFLDHLKKSMLNCDNDEEFSLGKRAYRAFSLNSSLDPMKNISASNNSMLIIDNGYEKISHFYLEQKKEIITIIGAFFVLFFLYAISFLLKKLLKIRVVPFIFFVCVLGLLAAMLLPALSQVSEKARQWHAPKPPQAFQFQAPSTRIRKHFPETLLWNPEMISDENGLLKVEIPVADSITTFHVEADVISRSGGYGKEESELEVFQPFFVDLNSPSSFIEGDRIQIPVGLYNYLDTTQQVNVKLKEESWFDIVGVNEQKVEVDKAGVAHFDIHITKSGKHFLTAFAHTEGKDPFSDAIRREVKVIPNGKLVNRSFNEYLKTRNIHEIQIPKNSMDNEVFVKYYPQPASVALEGMEGMLRTPHGCFEQTSSASFPNVLILQYLQRIKQIKGQRKARALINLGYQRIVSFECGGGGFEWYGRDPGVLWLTAYGIQQLHATSRICNIDSNIITRCYEYLERKQSDNGSWNNNIKLSAYVAYVLNEAGMADRLATKKATAFLEKKYDQLNTYELALMANVYAFSSAPDKKYRSVINKLMELSEKEGDITYWKSTVTLTRAYGISANIETTALIAHAILHRNPLSINLESVLKYIVKNRTTSGTWGSTQATILALKVLLLSHKTIETKLSKIDIVVNNKKVESWHFDKNTQDIAKQCDVSKWLSQKKNKVALYVRADNNIEEAGVMYQISQSCYIPWQKGEEKESSISFSIRYDRTNVKINESIISSVSMKYNREKAAESMMIELGIPSGFSVEDEVFASLVKEKQIDYYTKDEGKVVLYVGKFSKNRVFNFEYKLRSSRPLEVHTPISKAYEYYEPNISSKTKPVKITVSK